MPSSRAILIASDIAFNSVFAASIISSIRPAFATTNCPLLSRKMAPHPPCFAPTLYAPSTFAFRTSPCGGDHLLMDLLNISLA
uniref:Uncharacterized protein n=1 Tax=Arundo donax TaxID=35708 RepID=A0A0A8YUU8_ARUDO